MTRNDFHYLVRGREVMVGHQSFHLFNSDRLPAQQHRRALTFRHRFPRPLSRTMLRYLSDFKGIVSWLSVDSRSWKLYYLFCLFFSSFTLTVLQMPRTSAPSGFPDDLSNVTFSDEVQEEVRYDMMAQFQSIPWQSDESPGF